MEKKTKNSIDTTLYNEKSLYLLNIRELRDIGRKFGVPSPTTMKKQDLIEYILKIVYGEAEPSRSNYGRPNVREFNMEQYVSKIKKNSDLTDELLKVKLDDFDVGVMKLASPKPEETPNNIENRVFIEENGKCYLRVHGFVESEKDIELSQEYAKKFGLENFDIVEARIENNLFKIITINGVSQKGGFDEFVNEEKTGAQKKVFYVRTKEEKEEKIKEIVEKIDTNCLKLLIFANKKYTEKCTEFVQYDIGEGYSKMYKNFMRFVGLCEKYIYDGEDIVVLLDDAIDIEDMCEAFDAEVNERVRANIKQILNRITALGNLLISFRIEASKDY